MLPGYQSSRKIRQGGKKFGFEVVTFDDRSAPLASVNTSSPESYRWLMVWKYKVDVVSFGHWQMPDLQVKEDTTLFIIDEVGKMELFTSSFFPVVVRILKSNIPVLASITIPKLGRDIPAVARLKNHLGQPFLH